MKRVRIGTRGSALARAQSKQFGENLKKLHPGLEVEFVIITTSGDRFSVAVNAGEEAAPPGAADAPNLKAMFVKELETALLENSIDMAVHSSKDLPAELPEGLMIAAYPLRADPRDAFIGGGTLRRFDDLPKGALVGTASLRRSIQLAMRRPDLRFAPLRGNVDTRLRKLAEGKVAGVILAEAGLARLGRDEVRREQLGPDILISAPGQGALAVEARSNRDDVRELLSAIDHPATRVEVEMERGFMQKIGGGCATPLGALARAGDSEVEMAVFWSDARGSNPIRLEDRAPRRREALSKLVADMSARIKKEALKKQN